MDPVDELIRKAVAAFEMELRAQLGELDRVPPVDAASVGTNAAREAAASLTWADVGPFLDAAGARNALGVDSQTLTQRMTARRVLGLVLAGDAPDPGQMVFPAWQFEPQVLAQLAAVLAAAGYDPVRPTSGWGIAAWLTTPDADLEGRSALDALRAGELDRVLASARAVADADQPPSGVDRREAAVASPDVELDEGARADALTRGRERFAAARERLYADSLTPQQVAAASGQSVAEVKDLMASGGLVVVDGSAGSRLPRWQFDDDGRTLPGLADVLEAFPDSPVMLEQWMHQPNPMLRRRTPREALRDGDALEVRDAARAINLR